MRFELAAFLKTHEDESVIIEPISLTVSSIPKRSKMVQVPHEDGLWGVRGPLVPPLKRYLGIAEI